MQFLGLGVIALWLAGVIGWVMNLMQIVALATSVAPVTTMFIIKCVGVLIAPVGAFLGWIG